MKLIYTKAMLDTPEMGQRWFTLGIMLEMV